MKQKTGFSALAAGAVALGLLLGTSLTQAAEVELDGAGNVLRVTNLELNLDTDALDGFYDVEFINGTGLNIYGTLEEPFDFPPEENGIAIVQLNNALNLNNPVPTGASSAGTRQYYIPAVEYFGLWAAFGGEYFPAGGLWDACEVDCLSGIEVVQPEATATYAKFTLADGEPPPPTGVDLTGTVQDQGGTPLCALVLASGQFDFSCNPSGPYSLLDLPTESDGTVTRQVYVDGFFPNVETLPGSDDETVVMTRANNCPDYNVFPEPGTFPESAGKRIDVSGTVLLQNTQTPVCAMVLGNGQFGFTCDGTGSYAANIPLDANGQYKLQVYADGFAPMVQRFDEFTTNVEVRLASLVPGDGDELSRARSGLHRLSVVGLVEDFGDAVARLAAEISAATGNTVKAYQSLASQPFRLEMVPGTAPEMSSARSSTSLGSWLSSSAQGSQLPAWKVTVMV